MVYDHKMLATDAQVKMTDGGGSGALGMYVSTWQPWDRVRPVPERPRKGAFAPHLPAFIKDGFIATAHDWGRLPIATITDAREDEVGLWVEAEFHSTPAAQEVRTAVQERLARGKSVKTSIGYTVLQDEFIPMDDPALAAQGIARGRELVDVPLFEASIVNVPANPAAEVRQAKALARPGAVLTAVKSLYDGNAQMAEWEAREVMQTLLCYIRDGHLLEGADPAILTILARDLAEARAVVTTLLTGAEGSPPADPTQSSMKRAPVDRTPFLLELSHAETAVRAVVDRAVNRAAIRRKEGRRLSAATLAKLVPVPNSLRELADTLDALMSEPEIEQKTLTTEYLRFLQLEAQLNGVYRT